MPAVVRTRVRIGSRASTIAPWRCETVTPMPRSSAMTNAFTAFTRALMFLKSPGKSYEQLVFGRLSFSQGSLLGAMDE